MAGREGTGPGIEGADKDKYQRISARQSRLLTFPDGMERVITLRAWYWQSLDWLKDAKFWNDDDITAAAYQLSIESSSHRSFEEELRHSFELMIRSAMSAYYEDGLAVSNSNHAVQDSG